MANESNVPVWFDDVRIAHWQGLQVQEQHYDPFGLDLAGLSRSTPGLRTLNQYQWNGKEKQGDFGLGWTNLDWHFFDPQTERFHTMDPLSDVEQEMWSTYQYGFDNAIRFNDPDGRSPGDIINAAEDALKRVVQPVTNAVTNAAKSVLNASPYGLLNSSEKKLTKQNTLAAGTVYYNSREAIILQSDEYMVVMLMVLNIVIFKH